MKSKCDFENKYETFITILHWKKIWGNLFSNSLKHYRSKFKLIVKRLEGYDKQNGEIIKRVEGVVRYLYFYWLEEN